MRKRVPYTRSLAVAAGAMLAVAALAVSNASAATLSGAAHAVPSQSGRPLMFGPGRHVFTNGDSGQCLNQDYNSGVAHPDVLAYACISGSANEYWDVATKGDGSWGLINEASGGCLTDTGGAATVEPCDGSTAQAWYYVSVYGVPGYYFVNQSSGACLNQDWNSGVQHQDVLVYYTCDFTPNEEWYAS